jgi:hypothetical protein
MAPGKARNCGLNCVCVWGGWVGGGWWVGGWVGWGVVGVGVGFLWGGGSCSKLPMCG